MRNHEVTQEQQLLKKGQIAEPGWSSKHQNGVLRNGIIT